MTIDLVVWVPLSLFLLAIGASALTVLTKGGRMARRTSRDSTTGHWVHAKERLRELVVRGVPCPDCDAGPEEKCWMGERVRFTKLYSQFSHVQRYRKAASIGLVPPLPGEE